MRVAFAAETENLKANATAKLAAKRADFIVANDVTAAGSGFGTETNEVTIFHREGEAERLPLLSKYAVAHTQSSTGWRRGWGREAPFPVQPD